ncbi:MAG: VWA domain-containing protein [Planctomycetota bacterium]
MRLPYTLGFDHPEYLWLLVGLPVLWFLGWQSLASLGSFRRVLATLFRSAVWVAIVLAIAGVQWIRRSDRLTVMYLLDQSDSIPAETRSAMLDYVINDVRAHRDKVREDRAGIIVFGRDAAIEIPPFDDDIPALRRLESLGGRVDATNLQAAMDLAGASMPEDTARRLVIVTDGNENFGSAQTLATRLARSGVGIDVVPVVLQSDSEVLLEKIDLPENIRKGQPFEARVVLTSQADQESGRRVSGRLRVTQSVGGQESLLADEEVSLEPGKNVFPLRHEIDQPAAYTYQAEFVPDDSGSDSIRENNSASAYTYVRGSGRVLLIENAAKAGQQDEFIESLRDANIEVVVQDTNNLFGSLAELQAYDAVILAGVPRVGDGGEGQEVFAFTNEQIDMLVTNTQQLGAGLLMTGSPTALGAGGWSGTRLEEAMPVDFQIKNTKVKAVGALALIMHASEMANGNYWQKVIAKAAVEQLGPSDYAGVLHWTMQGDAWLWGGGGMLPVGDNRRQMLAAIGRMTPGDMPQFDPAMRMAVSGLVKTPAAIKHCVIVSDGDPSAPSPGTISAFKKNKITISTVAVASHGLSDSRQLQDIASATGGKYYSVASGKALPRIFQREARRVARPLVFEPSGGVVPEVVFPHPLLEGVSRQMPRIGGFVLTQVKDSPLTQVLIRSPEPAIAENSTVLSVWTYGLGRTAVLTTDTGERWATEWTGWGDYDKFNSQLVRWLMRPTGDDGKLTLATQVRDGEIEVVVNALSDDDEFLNFLDIQATAVGPDMKPIAVRMRQDAPGRYVGTVPADKSGSYFVNLVPGPGKTPLSRGVTVPYSDEYRIRESNLDLMTRLASLEPKGGQAGVVTDALSRQNLASDEASQPFRDGLAPARSLRDIWPIVCLMGLIGFWGDVLIRRVAIDPRPWLKRLRRRRQAEAPESVKRLDRLRQIKETADDGARRGAARYEPNQSSLGEAAGSSDSSASFGSDEQSQPKSIGGAKSEGESQPEAAPSYTERLLEAKRRSKR